MKEKEWGTHGTTSTKKKEWGEEKEKRIRTEKGHSS